MTLPGILLALRNRRYFSSTSVSAMRYSIGKDPSSLPSALTQKFSQNPVPDLTNERPIYLRYKVISMIHLSQLDKAAQLSRLAALQKYRNNPDTIHMCNDIIEAMSGSKRYDEAIALFHYFFNVSNLLPNIVSFNHIIKIHCEENRVNQAIKLYRHVRFLELDNEDTYRYLTKGLVNSGRIDKAVSIVEFVSMFDSVVYTYLIRGFLDQGNHHKADQLFDNFRYRNNSDVSKLCATTMDYWFKQGNDEKAMWVYKYSKAGNSFLKVFLEHGKQSEAWRLFKDMIPKARRFRGTLLGTYYPNTTIRFHMGIETSSCYSNIIERFCERGMFEAAEKLFEEMWSDKDLVVCYEVDVFRLLINGYVKVGKMDDAHRMLKKRDTYQEPIAQLVKILNSSSLPPALTRKPQLVKILNTPALTPKLSRNPVHDLIDVRPKTLRFRVNAMIQLCQLDKAAEISRLAVLEKYRYNPVITDTCNDIIEAMSRSKRYNEAIALFNYFFEESKLVPNIVSYNHIIKIHCEENRLDKALELYHHVRVLELDDKDTYRYLTKGLVNSGRIDEAVGMIKELSMFDSVVYTNLIRGFFDQGNYHKAEQLFNEFKHTIFDYEEVATVSATFVDYWLSQDEEDEALEYYNYHRPTLYMERVYSKSGNTYLKVFLKNGVWEKEAWRLFKEMVKNSKTQNRKRGLGVRLGRKCFDSETISIMVNECFKHGEYNKAIKTFKMGSLTSHGYSEIIDKFCKRRMMSEAEGLFEEMSSDKDLLLPYEVATLRSLINGYVKVGKMDDAQRMLKKLADTTQFQVSIRQPEKEHCNAITETKR